LPVLRRRLLAEEPSGRVVTAVAQEYARQISKMRMSHAMDEQTRQDAEDEQHTLQQRLAAAYPFHPALIDLMRERWASLPDFQRARGALRFLAVCLHVLQRENRADVLLGPGEIPIDG
jgi:predicted AAA+ superfamily ATPase